MNWITAAGGLGGLGVVLGAFGAHALKNRISPEMFNSYATAVDYHLLHAAVVLAVALYARATQRSCRWSASTLCSGIALFSGSLYAYTLTGNKTFAWITPVGGLLLIAGWFSVAIELGRAQRDAGRH